MRLAHFNCRAVAGLSLAISLVAIGPDVAVAQYPSARSAPSGRPNTMAPSAGIRANGEVARESLIGQNQGFRWPKMPFSRKKEEPQQAAATSQRIPAGRSTQSMQQQGQRAASGPQRGVSMPAHLQAQQRQSLPKQFVSQPESYRRSPAINRSQFVTPPSIAPQRTAITAKPNARTMQRTATTAEPKLAPRMPATTAAAPATQPSQESQAVVLLTQAHEWSTSAQTENEFTRIIEACRQAQGTQPNAAVSKYASNLNAWAYNRRGQLRADAGRDREALSDFSEAIKADPNCWRALHNRAVLNAQAGEFETAFNDFTRTIEINAKFAKAYSNRAALFVVAGNIPPAMHDYSKAVELDPELAVAHRGLGRAYHLAGKLNESVRSYDEAISLSPNDAYAIASRADVLTDQGKYADAAADYERAIAADNNSSQANSGSAWLLATCPDQSIRNPELAIKRAETAVQLTERKDAASFDALAAAQASAGDFDSAKKSIGQAIQLASNDEKKAIEARLALYERKKAYHIAPLEIAQVSYEEEVK